MIGCYPRQPDAGEVDFLKSDSELKPAIMEIESLIRSGAITSKDFEYPVAISGIPNRFSEIPGYTMIVHLPGDRAYYCKFTSEVAVPSGQLYSSFMNYKLTIKAIVRY
jgi:hypothetical protein